MNIEIDDQVSLELTSARHAAGLFAAVDRNRPHLSTFLPWVDGMRTVADMESYLSNCELLYEQKKEVSFVIKFDGDTIGRIGLHHMNIANKNAAIGYWLDKKQEGKGIIIRCSRRLIDLGFTELGLHRIEIRAAVQNNRSRAIPVKLHFKEEGLLREAEWVNGKFLDLVVFSMLSSEWENLKQ